MKTCWSKKLLLFFTLSLLVSSIFPIYNVSAFVVLPGVVYNCDNEYYAVNASVPAGLNFDNISVSLHWCSFNGIGFNITYVDEIPIKIA